MNNFSEESCRGNRHTHILYSIIFLVEICSVCKIMWKNIVERDRPQKAIGRMRIACWITKATDTNSDYVILIAFPRRKWLQERASTLTLYVLPALIYFVPRAYIVRLNTQLWQSCEQIFFFLLAIICLHMALPVFP